MEPSLGVVPLDRVISGRPVLIGELVGEDWDAEIAGLDALDNAKLQHLHYFVDRRPQFERGFDVPARARRIHVRIRNIKRDAQQLDFLRGQRAAGVHADPSTHELVRPDWVKLEKRIPRFVPLAQLPHLIAGRGGRGHGPCGGLRAGRLGLLEQERRTQAATVDRQKRGHLENHQDFVAARPCIERSADVAASAVRVKVRAGRVDGDADHSTSFRGRMPVAHGLVLIFTHPRAQAGSHSRSVFNAASQGPVARGAAGVFVGVSVFIN